MNIIDSKWEPRRVGERTEGIILAALMKLGYSVLIPFGASHPYDLVVDDGSKLLRVQCKTGRIFRGAIAFPACSRSSLTGKRKTYRGRVDILAVYCPANEKIYWVPVEKSANHNCTLRLDPTDRYRNARKWAKDYELAA